MTESQKIPEVSIFRFIRDSINILKNPLPFHLKNFQEKGDTFKLKIGLKNYVIFSRDAAFAEYVLQKNHRNYTKSKIQTVDLVKYVGRGLLTSEGELWKKQRQLIQPAFHKKQLANLLDTVLEAIQTEYKRIPTGKKMDVFPIFNDLAFQTVVKSLFSAAANPDDIKHLQHITESGQQMLVKELRQSYLVWWFKASGILKKHLDLVQEARQILKNIVYARRASGEPQDDLLDMLLEARYEDGNYMDEEQLIDEILILFTAGHETTSNALTFIFQLLALHPEWQEKIFEEIKSNENERHDLMAFVMKSKVCQQVIEEGMRLYPPAYFIDRVNVEEDTFEGKIFEKGSNLLFSVYEIHRHPELWDRPLEFRPERFEEGSRKFSSHYFPFGAGPRKCIGNNFAMFEMIIAVTELIQNYKVFPEFETIEITPLITLKPKNALLKFEKRS
ncbi:cytochrome P450 [Subsaximicrobium wynnwilliamsii]|uniref:Cytochrome P450 n=1 Tax=Subsaximicrobium wynnwilliamsii TaxID=291179 RepID=A0A5C6ZDU0_9FLAO|nr:cytochrome P450 [Subsaximicrobium wynnwilliamsii]TXD82432.1 cytochrome P450 [Subsaximicrobium wynnwilliamsii]TXD88074.1 cytochrome P450 [Subsaximicrobium wynnwilliamsii]TXE02064.1 cytochrome P450 [Subsaximicrobium wynnwilliamsii]